MIVFIPAALVPVIRVVGSVGMWFVQLVMLTVCPVVLAT